MRQAASFPLSIATMKNMCVYVVLRGKVELTTDAHYFSVL